MPLTEKGEEIMAALRRQYGDKAEQVFYAMKNEGSISGVDVAEPPTINERLDTAIARLTGEDIKKEVKKD